MPTGELDGRTKYAADTDHKNARSVDRPVAPPRSHPKDQSAPTILQQKVGEVSRSRDANVPPIRRRKRHGVDLHCTARGTIGRRIRVAMPSKRTSEWWSGVRPRSVALHC